VFFVEQPENDASYQSQPCTLEVITAPEDAFSKTHPSTPHFWTTCVKIRHTGGTPSRRLVGTNRHRQLSFWDAAVDAVEGTADDIADGVSGAADDVVHNAPAILNKVEAGSESVLHRSSAALKTGFTLAGNWSVMEISTIKHEISTVNMTEVAGRIERTPSVLEDQLGKLMLKIEQKVAEYQSRAAHPPAGSYHMSHLCADAALAAAGVSLVALTALPELLELFGFASEGVEAESVASGWQSKIGDVKAGSAFAILQSIAMGGLAKGTYVLVPASAAGTAAAVCAAFDPSDDERRNFVVADAS
jgi:hypothetical protein